MYHLRDSMLYDVCNFLLYNKAVIIPEPKCRKISPKTLILTFIAKLTLLFERIMTTSASCVSEMFHFYESRFVFTSTKR